MTRLHLLAGARSAEFDGWDGGARAWLTAELGAACVGWRCRIVGPEPDAFAASAFALARGAVAEEIEVVVTDPGRRRVYCPVCGRIGPVDDGRCACGAGLTVTTHYSAHHAAVLGVPT